MKHVSLKRAVGILLTLACASVLVAALAGCSSSSNGSSSQSSSATSSTSGSATSDQGTKTLVAYFSGSGNTERVAQEIATSLGADLFAIEPAQPYTSDDLNWRDEDSRVNAEHENEALRNMPLVKTTPDDFADYDTVFIGYPIWWGIAAWPVDGFVSGNDFAGKTVIPFCTSTSSGLGESATLLENLAGSGTWLEGQRFASNASANEVQTWLDSLDVK